MKKFSALIVFGFLMMLSACGLQKYPSVSLNGSFYDQGLSENTEDLSSIVIIDQNSTISFTPTSVKAFYKHCAGYFSYFVVIKGPEEFLDGTIHRVNDSILISSTTMPQLNYTYLEGGPGESQNPVTISPNLYSLVSQTGGSGINFAKPGTFEQITFTKATDKRVAFRFRFSYGFGLELGGTVDVPLTPGRKTACL